MKENKNIQVEKIDGIDPKLLTRVVIEDKDGNSRWAIKNAYGKITPFFSNGFHKFAYDKTRFLFIGEKDGINQLYSVHGAESETDEVYTRIITFGEIVYATRLNRTDLIIKTDRGEYLFDIEKLEPKSDMFDSIVFLNNKLVFKKDFSVNGVTSTYYGEVDNKGRIGAFLYDSTNDYFINTPIDEELSRDYDVIDDMTLSDILAKSAEDKSKIKKSKMQMLLRLNGVAKR